MITHCAEVSIYMINTLERTSKTNKPNNKAKTMKIIENIYTCKKFPIDNSFLTLNDCHSASFTSIKT